MKTFKKCAEAIEYGLVTAIALVIAIPLILDPKALPKLQNVFFPPVRRGHPKRKKKEKSDEN